MKRIAFSVLCGLYAAMGATQLVMDQHGSYESNAPSRADLGPSMAPGYHFHDIIEDLPVRNMDTDVQYVDLHALADDAYTRVTHPLFPHYGVRIKSNKGWCDTTRSYTGYIDIGAKHLFFYFFESRNPSSDFVLWTNGGPGGSSAMGLFMELGPCLIFSKNDTETPRTNPYSWTNNDSVIFIDQPVGVGFSYADYGEHVGRTEDAAVDIAAFVAIFLEKFIWKSGTDDIKFHLAGESYGGRYLPLFASQIVDQNLILKKHGSKPVPLKSVMIGNGLTDPSKFFGGHYDYACTQASGLPSPVLPISTCVRMRRALTRCEEMVQTSCIHRFDTLACSAASSFCESEIMFPFISYGLNPYDATRQCDGEYEDTLCYPLSKHIEAYLNRPDIRKMLGVSKKVKKYELHSILVGQDFNSHLDFMRDTPPYVEALLERGVRVLVYVGANDWICNHIGNYRWTAALPWSGQEAFNSQQLREWKVEEHVAGMTRNARGLTFATVYGAGHMAPYDKPKETLAMLNRWLAEQDL
ncbi:related to PRC1-carboxypeptidase y, serine-type protease [Serendipita indica DSM 11827]|uniref:Carboxypeptidase n=1 Tax=Serendipita indica (strain DSM 11827) TaxID=1109443 RepID=G4TQW0_SERID|nr:related to PRC1-carboxypeptidase y, serine-type protease [Serendipita indica DSM 11827]